MPAKIRSFAEPRFLYRYRSLRTNEQSRYELDALKKNYIWCAAFRTLNDPMEGLYRPSAQLRRSQDREFLLQKILDNKMSIGIASFSEANDHEVMWAHYAGQFAGICIEYNVSKLLKAVDDDVSLIRMSYNDSEPWLPLDGASEADAAKRILSIKNHRWAYEREWRLLALSLGSLQLAGSGVVSRIYIGARLGAEANEAIIKIAKRLEVRCHTMNVDGYSIKFDHVPIAGLVLRK